MSDSQGEKRHGAARPAGRGGCAVLDLDGTLHKATLGLRLLQHLSEQGLCDVTVARQLSSFLHDLGPLELDAQAAHRAYRLYGQAIAGIPLGLVREAAEYVWEREQGGLFPFAYSLLATLRDHFSEIVLLSGSPHEIVKVVAADLGIAHCQGAVFGNNADRYTDEVLLAVGVPGTKSLILRDLLQSAGLDLRRSTAVGNSAADIDVLRSVGLPIAFEPQPVLRDAAALHKWPITDRNSLLAVVQSMTSSDRS